MVYKIIVEYLSQTRGMEGRGELFLGHHPVRDDGSQIATLPVAACCSILTEAQKGEVGEERLAMLNKYYGRYFFTLFPNQIPHAVTEKLARNHAPVYLERRNLWDQYLSFAISVASGIWSTLEAQETPDVKLELNPCARTLGTDVLGYLELKRRLPPGPTIFYEDFVADMDCGRLLASIGMREKIDLGRIELPPKQNFGPELKLERFKDPDCVREDYRSSALNELQPLQ